ncbi:hypothetical protein [Ignicoccus hospitalis]|uniref:hypothetical protein n=1 Tax=Ignicoccus hospitalis TaxID=160233 RepID=UPI00164F962D|nr:hypothetical protein [Ignicoccus hospitalis]
MLKLRDGVRRGGKGRRDLKPKPLGDKCNPACPFFRCSQNALMFTKKYQRGKVITVVTCRLVGDKCIGYRCQYAYCEKKYLLPDGRCAWALRKEEEKEDAFLKEVEEEERAFGKLKNKLRGYDDLL